MLLCRICSEVLYQKERWLNNFDKDSSDDDSDQTFLFGHHETGLGLSSSAAEGCVFCLHFWSQLTGEEQNVLLTIDNDNIGYISLISLGKGEDIGLEASSFSLAVVLGDKGNLEQAIAKVAKKETPAVSIFVLQPSSGMTLAYSDRRFTSCNYNLH